MIEASHCNGCGDCQAFCRPGVFSPGTPDPSGIYKAKMSVANPFNCIVLCTRCEHVCPSGAITLPHPQDFKHFVEEYLD